MELPEMNESSKKFSHPDEESKNSTSVRQAMEEINKSNFSQHNIILPGEGVASKLSKAGSKNATVTSF